MDLLKFAMQRLFEPKQVDPTSDAKISASRRASAISGTSSARYYANRTRSLRSMERPQNLSQKLLGKSGKKMDPKEMRRFSSVQVLLYFAILVEASYLPFFSFFLIDLSCCSSIIVKQSIIILHIISYILYTFRLT